MSKKVLVVDDDKDMTELVKELLTEHDYEVLTAANGLEAIERSKDKRLDVILMDIRMPYFSGFWFCDVFKKKPETKDVPIVFVSALSDEEDMKKARSLGARAYLKKPFRQEQLLKIVEEACV